MAIVLNKPLPEFVAKATGGLEVTNLSHQGQTLVLFFYPKDNTPGCTTEAMEFRDKHKEFTKAGAQVFGVSRDNLKSHDDFKSKLELPFELIADTEEKMCHMFGVVKNKIMYGKKVKGIERSTFLIGPEGTLKQEWRGLKVPGHVEEVLKAVKTLNKGQAAANKPTTPAKTPAPAKAANPTGAPAAKKVAPAVKPTAKPSAKPATKPAAKTAAKPATKKAASPVAAKKAAPAVKKTAAKTAAPARTTSKTGSRSRA